MKVTKARLRQLIEEELQAVLTEGDNLGYQTPRVAMQGGKPYAVIRDPKSPNIRGASVLHDEIYMDFGKGQGGRRIVIMKLWLANGSTMNMAFYSSAGRGTPDPTDLAHTKKGQWVPYGGIVYKGHQAGYGIQDYVIKAPGKINNEFRPVGLFLEEIDAKGELPRKNVTFDKDTVNQWMQQNRALRADWLGGSSKGAQFYGLQTIEKFTIPVDPPAEYNHVIGPRAKGAHKDYVNRRIQAANDLWSRGLLTDQEFNLYRETLEYRVNNEHLYDGSEVERKARSVNWRVEKEAIRQEEVEAEEKKKTKLGDKLRARAGAVGRAVKGRRGYVVLPDAVSKIINNSRQKTRVSKPLQGADMAEAVGNDMQRQGRELAKESGITNKIFKIAGAVDTVMIADKAVKIIRDKKMSYKQQMDGLYDLGEEVALEAGLATAAAYLGAPGMAAYGLWVIGRLIASLPGESFETKDASGRTIDLHGGERDTYMFRSKGGGGAGQVFEFKNSDNYLYNMKVTKSNLKRIISEEIKNVDDLTKWAEKEMFEKLLLTTDSSRGPLRGKYNKKYAKLRYGFDSPEQAQKAFKKYALRILKNSGGDKNKFFDLVDDWITSTKKKLPDPYKGGGLVSGDPKRKAKYKKRFTQSFGEPFAETKRKFKLFKNITDAWREPALRTTKTVHMSREEAVKKGIISQVWDPKTPSRGFFDTRAAQDSQFWIQGRMYKDFKSMTGTDVIFANETNFEADDMMFGMYGFTPSKLKDKKQAERITRQLESNGFEKDKNGIYWSPTVLVSMQVQTHQRFPQLK